MNEGPQPNKERDVLSEADNAIRFATLSGRSVRVHKKGQDGDRSHNYYGILESSDDEVVIRHANQERLKIKKSDIGKDGIYSIHPYSYQ